MTNYTPEQREILDKLTADLDEGNARLEAAAQVPEGARLVGTPGGYWRQPQGRVIRLVPPGNVVSQYGTTWFRPAPRFDLPTYEVALSMMLGQHSAKFAARTVTKKRPKPNANVRWFRTDDLWLNGYTVYHTPSEHNRFHVSVYYGQPVEPDQYEIAVASWARPDRVTLDELAIPAGEAI